MRIKRQWGEWDDPSLQVLHCTTTTSSPKLTQIGEETFSVSVDHVCQLQKVPFTPKMYLPNPKKREHPNWPKLSKSLSFAANNKYLQPWFSTSITIEQSTNLGRQLPKLWLWIMLNRANTRSVYQWEFKQDRQDFPFQVTSDWQLSQF